MTGAGCERAALAVAAGLCAVAGWSGAAQAQTPAARNNAGRQHTSDAPVAFDIPAQPLAAALNAWAVQANTQVFVDPGPIAHLKSPAIKGTVTPRQALRALLAHSTLQVVRGADGVFVIKPRPTVAAAAQAPAPPPTPEVAAPLVVAAAPPPTLTARASEGPWMVGVSATYALDDGSATGGGGAAVAGEYWITDHVTAALTLTLPRSHSFEVPGGSVAAYRAGARLQSSALSLKYYFAPEQRLRPYLGAGIDVTTLYGARGVVGLDRETVGPRVAAGLDFGLSPHWMLNAQVSWTQIRPEVTGSPGRDIRLDPLQFGLGFVYRFATPHGWRQ